MRLRPLAARRLGPTLLALLLASVPPVLVRADDPVTIVPAGMHVHFHLLAPVSSEHSKSGEPFAFALLEPIVVDGVTIPVDGTTGAGTLILAGHAGSSGHEGDLTLRLDSLHAPDGRTVTFDDARLSINGRNRKIMSGVLGFVPWAGMGAYFIRGSEIRLDPVTPIDTVLRHPATIAADDHKVAAGDAR